jgi:polyhydroxyalkanoate synthase subunit PhaC
MLDLPQVNMDDHGLASDWSHGEPRLKQDQAHAHIAASSLLELVQQIAMSPTPLARSSTSDTQATPTPLAVNESARATWQSLDDTVHAHLGKVTGGLSPASLGSAWLDWLSHLAVSPGKQQTLGWQASQCVWQWLQMLAQGPAHQGTEDSEALSDKRFAAPQWQQWPYKPLARAFELHQLWWMQATTGVHGVSPHHEQLVAFMARQVLDMVSPSNLAWTNPEVLEATLETGGDNLLQGAQNQWRDTLQMLRSQTGQASLAEPAQATRPFMPGKDVAITPGKVVLRNALIELIQYTPQTPTVHAEPVLIVPPWIMKYYILDLSPQDSLVKYLVEHGHTVFIISWRNPGPGERDLGMNDYLKLGVREAMDAVQSIVPGVQIQALGYCLGGTLLSIAAAWLAREGDTRLKSLTLLTAEVDFTEPGDLSLFIDESQLHMLDDMMAEKGYLEGRQMAGAFALLNARDLLWSRMVNAYLMGRQLPVNDLGAWNADVTRMPYRQHSEYLRELYRDNDLAQGRYQVDGKPVALRDITLPIFLLGTVKDTVAPWRSVYKLHLLARSDITFCLSSGGHNVGVVNPPTSTGPHDHSVHRSHQLASAKASDRYVDPDTWQTQTPHSEGSWWPAWQAWLSAQSSGQVAPPTVGHPEAGYAPVGEAPGQYVLML